tara:strand:- start:71548 stop:72192 length:645 start_codon:yes stop_codon:yes gene_type:complete
MSNQDIDVVTMALERFEPGKRRAGKRQIMHCALACFEELGLEASKIEDIRLRAESSIGSIYHHFGNKEGLIASLFFLALDDQHAMIEPRMAAVCRPREAVEVMVKSYLEWVEQQPRLARFMYQARHTVAAGPRKDELIERNRQRFSPLLVMLQKGVESGEIRKLPREIYASLLIGQSENYCRAWLSSRVRGSPMGYQDLFAEAAWFSIAARHGV